ncbi:MAG: gamma-glutamyltranspeptidase [Planctomycetota bacterium]|nr:MAG: gamma-glutamyltranspeptidase [Planctomycetota bacterium]
MRFFTVWLGACVLMSLAPSASAGDRILGAPFATRSPVIARHGMVATSQPLAAQVGLDILKAGGSAVDAAIATNAALALMEPTGCGVGGDLFVLLWDNDAKELVGLNGSGRSPSQLDLEGLRAVLAERGLEDIPLFGGLPVSVPGAVDGWFAMHERYGRLPMSQLLAPAIAAAREGFPLTQVIAEYWRRSERVFGGRPEFAEIFMPNGRAPREGELFRNPGLARTLEALAAGGRDAFYTGPLAEALVAAVQREGGFLTLDDLAAHRSEWVQPQSVSYRDHELWELPPNGQGLAAQQLLQIVGQDQLHAWDADTWHLLIEAKKLAYEDRARFYADPAFAEQPLQALLSPTYASARRALIDPARAAEHYPAGGAALAQGDTVYLTVADADGNVVSWIQSNYTGFGSGVVVPGWGFGLQNRAKLFHLDASHANVYAPGKRPFHTIIPAMLTRDGSPVLSFGVMGGAMQPQGHAQIVVNMLDFGMNVQEAGDAARWRHEGSSQPDGGDMRDRGRVFVESGAPAELVEGLRARGHQVEVSAGGYGGYQAIWIDAIASPEQRLYRGASESRKDGAAVGF